MIAVFLACLVCSPLMLAVPLLLVAAVAAVISIVFDSQVSRRSRRRTISPLLAMATAVAIGLFLVPQAMAENLTATNASLKTMTHREAAGPARSLIKSGPIRSILGRLRRGGGSGCSGGNCQIR